MICRSHHRGQLHKGCRSGKFGLSWENAMGQIFSLATSHLRTHIKLEKHNLIILINWSLYLQLWCKNKIMYSALEIQDLKCTYNLINILCRQNKSWMFRFLSFVYPFFEKSSAKLHIIKAVSSYPSGAPAIMPVFGWAPFVSTRPIPYPYLTIEGE